MLKQKVINTSLGELTFTSLTLGELRQLDAIFQEPPKDNEGVTGILKYLPLIHSSVRKAHQDMTAEQMEQGLDIEDFNLAFSAMLEVSGLKKTTGEAIPATTPA